MTEKRLAQLNAQFKPSLIATEIHGKVAIVKFLNHFGVVKITRNFMKQVDAIFLDLEKDDNIAVIIMTGTGNQFAVGADVTEIAKLDSASHFFDDMFERECWLIVPEIRKPVISAINGMCFGGGLETAMMADIILCSEGSMMGQPEINLALVPGCGGAVRLA